MLNAKTVAVVIPAFNEEKQIGSVIESMPDFVDRIIIVNDRSTDRTAEAVLSYQKNAAPFAIPVRENVIKNRFSRANETIEKMNREELKYFIPAEVICKDPHAERIILINQSKNGGVGAAIARGYKWCKDYAIDCTAVMAGDGQMDPDELESLCRPVVTDGIDYVKGNRLIHQSAWLVIPKVRYFGNSILSILTKVASGYWHVSDTQTGYTALSKKALNAIKLYAIYKRYGMPNDMLVRLNIAFCTLKEVPIKPVYNVGEQSKMKVFAVVPMISFLLCRSFFKRLWVKYLFRDFHPLFLLYHLAFLLGILDLPYLYKVVRAMVLGQNMSFETLFAFTALTITSLQSYLFAMWMDIQDNERMYKS
jgi:glycosyltransferase involved in cell wall biosynthesis